MESKEFDLGDKTRFCFLNFGNVFPLLTTIIALMVGSDSLDFVTIFSGLNDSVWSLLG